ncbi:hypothetical protein POX_c03685 [Penicillium oxalicum]|uniref:Uncharacterized protein n=1 Tax=Penicillium oxalicum (strain 114-2 / CGMCC 5302) TaxID=933388 RepID=S8ATY3_PENO1|nr:hypothetical protein POX_c03685 [Penicillium oxalicum]EPS25282.1 hypothetical protein PDE_00215 [Penicillium oxalicum 114-2]KAI2790834.1 hypothetical protein POX_c03685 [Penicillium oxalicum]
MAGKNGQGRGSADVKRDPHRRASHYEALTFLSQKGSEPTIINRVETTITSTWYVSAPWAFQNMTGRFCYVFRKSPMSGW